MRRLTLQMQTSVDGYVGRDTQSGPEWQVWDWGKDCPWDDPLKYRFNHFFADVDTILLSRKLVDGYLEHWTEMAALYPARPAFAFARRILEARKVVFSKTVDETKWPATEVARRSLVDEVHHLKALEGKNIVAFGGAGFASALIAQGLVDEFEFYVNPTALGAGLSIFREKGAPTGMELIEATPYACGVVVIRYVPVPQ